MAEKLGAVVDAGLDPGSHQRWCRDWLGCRDRHERHRRGEHTLFQSEELCA